MLSKDEDVYLLRSMMIMMVAMAMQRMTATIDPAIIPMGVLEAAEVNKDNDGKEEVSGDDEGSSTDVIT